MKTKTQQKHNTICVGHHYAQTRHAPFYKQLEVKTNRTNFVPLLIRFKEKFEGTEGAIRSRNSKKDRQYKRQRQKDKQ
jgi:hypothetical protein